MPIYEYRCKKCGETNELLIALGEDKTISCQKCGSLDVKRIMSAPTYLSQSLERSPGHTCCGREERCDTPPCSSGGTCRRD